MGLRVRGLGIFCWVWFLGWTGAVCGGEGGEVDWKFLETWIGAQQKVSSLRAEFRTVRRLPAVRLPQEKAGRLWFQAPGMFRMEVGEPAELVLLGNGKRERFEVVNVKRKSVDVVRVGDADGASVSGGQLMAARFPFAKTLGDFLEEFEVKKLEFRGGKAELVLSLREATAKKAVKEIRLRIDEASGVVEGFVLAFRNGGELQTDFTQVWIGEKLEAEVFVFDTEGYRVQEQ